MHATHSIHFACTETLATTPMYTIRLLLRDVLSEMAALLLNLPLPKANRFSSLSSRTPSADRAKPTEPEYISASQNTFKDKLALYMKERSRIKDILLQLYRTLERDSGSLHRFNWVLDLDFPGQSDVTECITHTVQFLVQILNLVRESHGVRMALLLDNAQHLDYAR